MATVFMKWLETNPQRYDQGIRILTLGRLERLKEEIAHRHVRKGMRVLEIGCGTGTLTTWMAARGAVVTALDASPRMLAEARKKVTAAGMQERVTLLHMDATQIGDRFPAASFDLIVSTLVFSELSADERGYVLRACARVLAPGGELVIADEVLPDAPLARFLYHVVRWPLLVLTWLLTRATTSVLRNVDALFAHAGFEAQVITAYLGGSLVLCRALPVGAAQREALPSPPTIERLRHRTTLASALLELWTLLFRIIPPYPRVRTGLYRVGEPGPSSPVLVTGNFFLTVRRLVHAIDGQVDVWLLVADSAGINVWCAAGGGYFTAQKVIAAMKSSRLEEVVDHRVLILPQLCANGVDGWEIRKETGWQLHWGPVRAEDIPAYLDAGCKKTDAMRWVRFPLKDRLEMVTVTLGFYAWLILLPVFLFWREMFWPIAASLISLSYIYAIVHLWLPGRDGLYKSIPLSLISLLGLALYSAVGHPLPTLQLFNWGLGLVGLSVFTAAELQGMSPLMRGEQANWGWEAMIAVALGAIYWLVPRLAGWR